MALRLLAILAGGAVAYTVEKVFGSGPEDNPQDDIPPDEHDETIPKPVVAQIAKTNERLDKVNELLEKAVTKKEFERVQKELNKAAAHNNETLKKTISLHNELQKKMKQDEDNNESGHTSTVS